MANDLKMEVILQAIDRATRPIRAITQGSIGLGRALKESRDQLKTLQAQQADIRSWTILRNASAKTQTELQDARARVKELGRQMAASGVPTRQMAEEMQSATCNGSIASSTSLWPTSGTPTGTGACPPASEARRFWRTFPTCPVSVAHVERLSSSWLSLQRSVRSDHYP